MQNLRGTAKFIEQQLAPLKDRIAQLEETLEQFGFRGHHTEGCEYHKGNFVTLGGSLWHANETTCSRPSTDNPAWSIACKRGRDGRDRTCSPTAASTVSTDA
jgi:hypothetical protein